MQNIKRLLQILTLTLSLPLSSFAQGVAAAPAAAEGAGGDDVMRDTLEDVVIVVAAGLAGAILGLSTLSFVDEPKEHLNNVLVGGSIGIIGGVGLVAYRQASKSQKYYDELGAVVNPKKFTTAERNRWHNRSNSLKKRVVIDPFAPKVSYSFTF